MKVAAGNDAVLMLFIVALLSALLFKGYFFSVFPLKVRLAVIAFARGLLILRYNAILTVLLWVRDGNFGTKTIFLETMELLTLKCLQRLLLRN
jgi:hypothetical protein